MKLALRDLFWLVVIAAIGTCWTLERVEATKKLREVESASIGSARSGPIEPTADSIAREALLVELRLLSDENLYARAAQAPEYGFVDRCSEFSCCLTEMVRRGMHKELKHLQEARPKGEFDLQLLTALRRAEGKRDPLKILVELPKLDRDGVPSTYPLIVTKQRNVDVEEKTLHLTMGGDYRSGRSERWRVHLTDTVGRRVEDSNFMSWHGGGILHGRELKAGETTESPLHLDARSYVKPPASGRYMLQVVHSDSYIVDEPNLVGMIVWSSEPVAVIVRNHGVASYPVSAIPLAWIVGIGGLIAAAIQIRRRRTNGPDGKPPSFQLPGWRTILPLCLIVILIAGWLIDSYLLRAKISRIRPDRDAEWTMQLAS